MRYSILIAIAAATTIVAADAVPAAAQLSVTTHVGPTAGRSGGVFGRSPVREIIVSPYDARRHGDYRRYAQDWRQVTLYSLANRYYQQPYRNARPVVVYSYRDNYFLEPRDRGWAEYRSRTQRNDRYDDRRDDRYDPRYDRRDDRYDRQDDRRHDSHDAWHDKQDDKYEREHAKEHQKQAKKAAKRRGNDRW